MRRKSKFLIITVVLLLTATFFTAGTVKSISPKAAQAEEAYYQELEKQYRLQVREYLDSRGFPNSGVTMTRILTEEGRREYKVLIHHQWIGGLHETEKEELKDELKELYSGMEECGFRYKFLEADL